MRKENFKDLNACGWFNHCRQKWFSGEGVEGNLRNIDGVKGIERLIYITGLDVEKYGDQVKVLMEDYSNSLEEIMDIWNTDRKDELTKF